MTSAQIFSELRVALKAGHFRDLSYLEKNIYKNAFRNGYKLAKKYNKKTTYIKIPFNSCKCNKIKKKNFTKIYFPKKDITKIQKLVCSYFNLTMEELICHKRIIELVRPRQIAMYLCHLYTENSLPSIGRNFGKRDHTTVIHSIRKIKKLLEIDLDIIKQTKELKNLI